MRRHSPPFREIFCCSSKKFGNRGQRATFIALIARVMLLAIPDCVTWDFLAEEANLSEEISFSDANGHSIHGNYEVNNGVLTVTTADGLSKTADVGDSMLSPETLARMLLLQMHQHEGVDPQISAGHH
jgi:hypothetical protein